MDETILKQLLDVAARPRLVRCRAAVASALREEPPRLLQCSRHCWDGDILCGSHLNAKEAITPNWDDPNEIHQLKDHLDVAWMENLL